MGVGSPHTKILSLMMLEDIIIATVTLKEPLILYVAMLLLFSRLANILHPIKLLPVFRAQISHLASLC